MQKYSKDCITQNYLPIKYKLCAQNVEKVKRNRLFKKAINAKLSSDKIQIMCTKC